MSDQDELYMRAAVELATRGQGDVEPNPMVGCILVRDGEIIGQGFHEKFGSAHAEVNAIAVAKSTTVGATAYVTLEPCSHVGKTGPCSQALIEAKVARVVVACEDPNPLVGGNGIKQLRDNGIDVTVGVLKDESKFVLAPYLKRSTTKTPWVIAKWAMTLDGKIATDTGDSKWISNEQSRQIVQQLRGRVDGIMVGIGTVLADDPMLNARPDQQSDIKRKATRIVVDSLARTPVDSKLVKTANEFPTLIAVGPAANESNCKALEANGCQVVQFTASEPNQRLNQIMIHLAEKGSAGTSPVTNLLVEGGGQLLGSLNDLNMIDEVHCFIGPTIVGGQNSKTPIGGVGHSFIDDSSSISIQSVKQVGNDVYIVGRTIQK